mgnify:CR=1 FL=1
MLRGFAGILDMSTQPGKTFRDEIAGRVRVIACLDVMPNIDSNAHFRQFGLTEKEITSVEKLFDIKPTDVIKTASLGYDGIGRQVLI